MRVRPGPPAFLGGYTTYQPVPTREAAHTTRQVKTLEQRTLTTKNLKRLQKMANIL